ncbi:MAG: site-specific integrase, partial [Firmicutes bacterium]|nr:site-specific integrase [Bacillota bacterium]
MKRANNTGSVYKMKGNRRRKYTAVITYYDEDKKRHRKYLGYYRTQKEAQTALERYIADPYKITKITFAQAFEKWSEKAFKKGSYQKQASYKAAFRKCSSLHDMKVQEIKLSHLQTVVDDLAGFSSSTIYNVKIVISGVFTYCMRNEYINLDYSRYIELPESSTKKVRRIFTEKEINALWDINEKSDTAAVILILIYTGYRISELLEMPKKNIDLKEDCII